MKTVTNVETLTAEQNLFLTTFDNSFDPFKNFELWFKEDFRLGYNTCGLLAITSNVSDVSSDEINDKYILDAMKEIVRRDPTTYRIVME